MSDALHAFEAALEDETDPDPPPPKRGRRGGAECAPTASTSPPMWPYDDIVDEGRRAALAESSATQLALEEGPVRRGD